MTSDTERMRALVHALECRQWSRSATLAAQLSALCDREGVLAAYLEARPLLDAVGQLVRLLAHAATAAHRADVAEAALVQLLEGLGQDDAPRARAIAAARSAATLLAVARDKAPETLEARGLEAVGRGVALARTLERCDHGMQVERVTLGRGCLDCAERIYDVARYGEPSAEEVKIAEEWARRASPLRAVAAAARAALTPTERAALDARFPKATPPPCCGTWEGCPVCLGPDPADEEGS